jgi:hypothetical protein
MGADEGSVNLGRGSTFDRVPPDLSRMSALCGKGSDRVFLLKLLP